MENLKEIRFMVCSWGSPDQDKEYELWDFISENYLPKKKINEQPRSFDDWYTETDTWLAVLGEELKSPRNNGFSSKNVIYWKQVNRKYKGSGGNESRMILVNPEIQQIVNKTFKPAWRQIHWSPWDLNVIVLFLDAWYLTQNMTCNNWYLTTVFNL